MTDIKSPLFFVCLFGLFFSVTCKPKACIVARSDRDRDGHQASFQVHQSAIVMMMMVMVMGQRREIALKRIIRDEVVQLL